MRFILLVLFFFGSVFAGWAHCNITDVLKKEYSLKEKNVFIELVNMSDYGEDAKVISANIKGDIAKSLYKFCEFVDNAENADNKIVLRILKIEDNDNLGGAAGSADKLNVEVQIFGSQNELLRKLLVENRTSKANVMPHPSELSGVFSYIYQYILSSDVKGDVKNYRYRCTRRDTKESRVIK